MASSSACTPMSADVSFPDLLASSLETLLREFHLPSCLPAEFRSSLLLPEEDPPPSLPPELEPQLRSLLVSRKGAPMEVKRGVPIRPLFKYLASALSNMFTDSAFPRQVDVLPGLPCDNSLKEKIDIWTEKIIESLAILEKLVQQVKLDLQVQENIIAEFRDFQDVLHVSLKYKSRMENESESKIHNESENAIHNNRDFLKGDFVLINRTFLYEVQIMDTREHSFQASRKTYGAILDNPDSSTGNLIDIRYSQIMEPDHAFQIQALPGDRQPFHILKNILELLDREGIKALMGFRSTVGSVKDALFPGWATLLASFLAINNEDISGCKLTVGARALAKHVHRSASGWWGRFSGSEDMKNMLALNVIAQIMKNAEWLNIHFVPPDSHVFEVRVREGYGARWSADGSKFRGFLEPQMECGHVKRWRH